MFGARRVVLLAAATIVAITTAIDVKNKRYCEVLFVRNLNGSTVADVYNTFGLNDCPAPIWSTITPANAKDNSSLAVVLNGPRYWLMDSIGNNTPAGGAKAIKNVGGINMTLVGRVPVAVPITPTKLYAPNLVTRNVNFIWKAGSRAFILTREQEGKRCESGDAGRRVKEQYIMQSYSQQVDNSLNLTCLPSLASRLGKLPPGWSYEAKRLKKDVNVTTPILVGGKATVGVVIQDEFQNTYTYLGNVDRYLVALNQTKPN